MAEVHFVTENYNPKRKYNFTTQSKNLSHAGRLSWRARRFGRLDVPDPKKVDNPDRDAARSQHERTWGVSTICRGPMVGYGWTENVIDFPIKLAELKQHMLILFNQNIVIQDVMPLVIRDKAMFSSMAYLACSSLDSLRRAANNDVALVAKGTAVRNLAESLYQLEGPTSSRNILAIGCVAASANIYDFGIGTEFLRHRRGIETIYEICGTQPPHEPDIFERAMNRMFALHRAVMPAVWNLEINIPSYPGKHLGHHNKFAYLEDEPHSRPDMVIESPFFCSATADFTHIQKSTHCTSRILELLQNFRKYYLLLEAESDAAPSRNKDDLLTRRVLLRRRILQFESIYDSLATDPYARISDKDCIYECIRLTCLALIHLSDICITGRIAFNPTPSQHGPGFPSRTVLWKMDVLPVSNPPPADLPSSLAHVFRKAPSPVHGWGPHMEGLLYWISTVGTAISRGRPEYALFSSVNAKAMWDMVFIEDGRSWDEAIVPIRTFTRFQAICLDRKIEPFFRIEVESQWQTEEMN